MRHLDEFVGMVREAIHEETADLRAQLYPNGGKSLADQIASMKGDITLILDGLADVKNRLEVMHPTGEIPITPAPEEALIQPVYRKS